MISPHTPPGTLVVFRPVGEPLADILPVLVPGRVYTLEAVEDCQEDSGGWGVALVETSPIHRQLRRKGWRFWEGVFHWFYCIEDFELAQLPGCLVELLQKAPAPKTRRKVGEDA